MSVEVQVSLENLGTGEVREQIVEVTYPPPGWGDPQEPPPDSELRAKAIGMVHRRSWFYTALAQRGPHRIVTRAFPSAKVLEPDA